MLLGQRDASVERGQVVGGAIGSGALNAATLFLNFAVILLLSRLLGASGYGAFAFAFAWAMLLSALAGLGLSPLVVRHVASAAGTENWSIMRGILRWANSMVLVAGLLASVVAAGTGALLLRAHDELLVPFLLGLLLVLPVSLTTIRQSAMQGLGKVVLGRMPETLVVPGVFFLLVASIGVGLGDAFSARWAMVLQAIATLTAFGLGARLLFRVMPSEAHSAKPEFHVRSWRRSALPLFLLGVLLMTNAQIGTIVLGAVEGPADAGVFAVATRVTTTVGFVLLAATYPLMPVVARLYAAGQSERMRAVIERSALVIFLLSLPAAVLVFALAGPILGIFGDEFGVGSGAVRVLVVGELVKALVGLAGLVLVMTGHEGDLTRSVAIGGLANILLALALVPLFGMIGAALAAAMGLGITQLLLARRARQRLGFSAAAFSFVR